MNVLCCGLGTLMSCWVFYVGTVFECCLVGPIQYYFIVRDSGMMTFCIGVKASVTVFYYFDKKCVFKCKDVNH